MKNFVSFLHSFKWLRFSLVIAALLLFITMGNTFFNIGRTGQSYIAIDTENLNNYANFEQKLSDRNIPYFSLSEKIPLYNWNRWTSFPLLDLEEQFYPHDPRNIDSYSLYRSFFYNEKGNPLIYIKSTNNPIRDYLRLRGLKAMDTILPLNISIRVVALLVCSVLIFITEGFKNRFFCFFYLLLTLFSDIHLVPFYPLSITLLFYTSEISILKKRNKWILLISMAVLLSILARSLSFFILSIIPLTFINPLITKQHKGDHDLFDPIFLLNKKSVKKTYLTKDHRWSLSIFSTLFLLLFLLFSLTDKQDQHIGFPENISTMRNQFYLDLYKQNQLIHNPVEKWSEITESENFNLEHKWLDSLIEFWEYESPHSLFFNLNDDSSIIEQGKQKYYIPLFIYLVIWLTIPFSLWQSKYAFPDSINFVFKIKRRLKVA